MADNILKKYLFIYLFTSVFRSKVLTFHMNLADDSHEMSRFVVVVFFGFFSGKKNKKKSSCSLLQV